ncbi:MAG: acyl-CoA synthetase, partial [Burkholderiales bacterium PBB5]
MRQAARPPSAEPVDSLNALLARQRAHHPEATAFIEVHPDTGAERRVSLQQFDDLVGSTSAWLQDQGVVAGDIVALWLVNRLDWLVLHFALARLGAVMVPVNFMLNADEAAYILRHAGVKLLAVDSGLHALGQEAAKRDTQISRF